MASALLDQTMISLRAPFRFWLVFLIAAALVRADEAKPLYAICGAYPPELVALRREFAADDTHGFVRTVAGGAEFWRGTYAGKDVILFRTGVSVVNAAYQLQFALDHFPITHVLFAGVAGGVDPQLHVGDVVIPERWAYHSEAAYLNEDGHGGYVKPDYLTPHYEHFGMMFPADVSVIRNEKLEQRPTFPADAALLDAARRAIKTLPVMRKAGREIACSVGGTGVSGPVFLDNAAYREWVFRVWSARCVDMESTALAHVAYVNGKPILVVRGLSDLAGGQKGQNPIDQNEASVAEIAARTLRAVLDQL